MVAAAASPEYTTYSILRNPPFIIIFIMNKEKRMKLAIEAFNKGQFQSKTACAKAFDVATRTLMYHLNGMVS